MAKTSNYLFKLDLMILSLLKMAIFQAIQSFTTIKLECIIT